MIRHCLPHTSRGVAALEFVILLPIYLMLVFGMLEVYQFFRTVGVIDRTAFSLGSLVAQKAMLIDNSSATDANNIGIFWAIAPQLATPLDMQGNGTVIITDVKDAGNATPVIAWQRTSPWGTGASQLGKSPLPSGFPFYAGDNTIVVEVYYRFAPFHALQTFWPNAPGAVNLYRRAYFRPRFQNLDTLQKS